MTDILRRNLAPLSADAWNEIDEQAVETLKSNLVARRLVDIDGPHGWSLSSVNLGRLRTEGCKADGNVQWGMRKSLPLIEWRIPFELNQWEVDNISRGAEDVDLGPVEDACREAARFEDQALFNGFSAGNVPGLLQSSEQQAVSFSGAADDIPGTVEDAVLELQAADIGGPYALVLDEAGYRSLAAGDQRGYPLRRRVKDILEGGETTWSPAVKTGAVISRRGGDFKLTLGQDISIGYKLSDKETVELYLTASFAFRVLEPAAAVVLTKKS